MSRWRNNGKGSEPIWSSLTVMPTVKTGDGDRRNVVPGCYSENEEEKGTFQLGSDKARSAQARFLIAPV